MAEDAVTPVVIVTFVLVLALGAVAGCASQGTWGVGSATSSADVTLNVQ